MLFNFTSSEEMLVHFLLVVVFILGTGLYLAQWLYMKDKVEQAILKERERFTRILFENSEE
jgi:hypothetical protein